MAEQVNIVGPSGERLTVSEKAFRVIYKQKGFKRVLRLANTEPVDDVTDGQSNDANLENADGSGASEEKEAKATKTPKTPRKSRS